MINTRNNLGTRGRNDRLSMLVGIGMAVAALILLASSARAQEIDQQFFDVHGTVVDADNGRALVGAWVSFPDSEWGSVTDDQGRFRLPDMSDGPLVLTVEQLGYEPLRWEGEISGDDASVVLELEPNPLLLEGLEVVTDRFRSRRNGVATSVFAYELDALTTTAQRTALDFVSLRTGSNATPCAGRRGDTCLFLRGRLVEPVVYLDETPVLGGLRYLESFAPHELYMIEIYSGGRHIRAYTPQFMERAAKTRLSPIALGF